MTEIPFKDWEKLDIRTAKILDVKLHPNADKLYILSVDLGSEQRELVAGLKNHYTEDELRGKSCIVFTNLEPAKIRGVESKGMILAAVNKDESKIILIQPENDIELGSRIS